MGDGSGETGNVEGGMLRRKRQKRRRIVTVHAHRLFIMITGLDQKTLPWRLCEALKQHCGGCQGSIINSPRGISPKTCAIRLKVHMRSNVNATKVAEFLLVKGVCRRDRLHIKTG